MKDWNQHYSDTANEPRTPELLVINAVQNRKPGRALDLGCGTGRNAIYLASKGWQVTAVDYSQVAIDTVKKNSDVEAVLADLEAGEFTIEANTYDLIVDCKYLQRSLFPSIKQGIKTGGLFIGVFPITKNYRLEPGEGKQLFGDWKLIHYAEGERTEILAEKLAV